MGVSAKDIVAKLETLPVKLEEGASFKVGFFLCRTGTASLIADGTLYHLQRGSLLMLYPNEQIHVLHYSDDLEGRMEVDYIENYYPTLESIDVRSRIVIRKLRCIVISEERTVVYYAQHLHISPYYLSGIIKKETGKTALEWLTLFTINLSKHYLADTEMSIKEIADTLHFPDQSTFGRYFKHHMGCSPGEYRQSTKLQAKHDVEKAT